VGHIVEVGFIVSSVLITSIMPAVVVGRPKRSEAMWEALKNHIIRERQKKKQGTPMNGP
jgi:hypothetical protein